MTNNTPNNPRIEQYMTKTTWLHFEDSLAIDKVKLFAGQYKAGQGSELALNHYVDALTIRPLLHDLSWGKAVEFSDYKGTVNGNGATSRVLRVNSKGDKVYWSLTHGPGKATKTGAVMPDRTAPDKAKTRLNVVMSQAAARQYAYAVLEYMTAWRTVNMVTQPPIPVTTANGNGRPPAPDGPPLDAVNEDLYA